MKRFVLAILIVLAAFALLYPPAVWLAGKVPSVSNVKYVRNNYGHSARRLAEADSLAARSEGIDLLFLGSSHCYRTFDTRFYAARGLRAFNLGSSNQTPIQTYALLQRYLAAFHPKTVVFEVHPDILASDGVESSADLLSNTRLDSPMRAMMFRQNNIQLYNTALCRLLDRSLHGGHLALGDTLVAVATPSGDTTLVAQFHYISGGFVQLSDYCFRPVDLESKTIVPNSLQLAALDSCLSLIARQGADCLLVEVPASRALFAAYRNHAAFADSMAAAARRHGFDYYDGNADTALVARLDDQRHFFDDDHLNNNGVTLFNRYFLSCILSD